VGVLDHHDRRVDHRADRDRDAAQAHDVGAMPSARMAMKAISTPTGSMTIATSALRTCSRKTTHTSGDDQALLEQRALQVAMARSISSERS
jgi:hypothetical protein